VNLTITRLDQGAQAFDAHPVGVAQAHLVQQCVTAHAEEVSHGHAHALFGQDRVDLGLEARALVDELGAIADVLAQLAQWRWSDPCLGQAAQPQEVDQVGGITLVVLDPPLTPVVPERVGQVHGCPALLENVDRPVPAIGGFEHHLGMLTGLGQF